MQSLFSSALVLLLLVAVEAFSPQTTSTTLTPWGIIRTDSRNRSAQNDNKLSPSSHRISPSFVTIRNRQHRQSSVSSSTTLFAAPKIVIAGAPASGKGTQCAKIQERFGVVHLSTGDMLRAAVAAGTPVGKEAKEYMDSGKLVPDSTIIGVVKDRLAQEDCQTKGWLLDGFPRTQAQAKALEDAGIQADCFIFLNVPDKILVERVVGRRTDPVTGNIYHMTFSPPEDEEVLARLEQRSDDTEEKIKVRLEQFYANVEAVKDSFTGIGVTIDGNQNPETVTVEIFEAIDMLLVKA